MATEDSSLPIDDTVWEQWTWLGATRYRVTVTYPDGTAEEWFREGPPYTLGPGLPPGLDPTSVPV